MWPFRSHFQRVKPRTQRTRVTYVCESSSNLAAAKLTRTLLAFAGRARARACVRGLTRRGCNEMATLAGTRRRRRITKSRHLPYVAILDRARARTYPPLPRVLSGPSTRHLSLIENEEERERRAIGRVRARTYTPAPRGRRRSYARTYRSLLKIVLTVNLSLGVSRRRPAPDSPPPAEIDESRHARRNSSPWLRTLG